jgi:hypothetical protein
MNCEHILPFVIHAILGNLINVPHNQNQAQNKKHDILDVRCYACPQNC